MDHSNKKSAYLCFLIACISLVFVYFSNQRKAPLDPINMQKTLTSTLLNVNAMEFNKEGEIERHLKSPLIKHHAKSLKKILFSPIIVLRKEGKPWKITANKATLLNHNQKIVLEGKVNIRQYERGIQTSQLLTRKLFYYPNNQFINTDENITYLNQGITLHSKGLKADLSKETIELVSKARGTYAKNTH